MAYSVALGNQFDQRPESDRRVCVSFLLWFLLQMIIDCYKCVRVVGRFILCPCSAFAIWINESDGKKWEIEGTEKWLVKPCYEGGTGMTQSNEGKKNIFSCWCQSVWQNDPIQVVLPLNECRVSILKFLLTGNLTTDILLQCRNPSIDGRFLVRLKPLKCRQVHLCLFQLITSVVQILDQERWSLLIPGQHDFGLPILFLCPLT